MERFVYKDKKKLRCGYTTGTCAALAARGAVSFLVSRSWPETETLVTPSGETVKARLEACGEKDGYAFCAVRKDAGDDYDVTDGLLVFSRARLFPKDSGSPSGTRVPGTGVFISGGEGVGRVTKAGLDQPVGEAAINSTPRRMIAAAVEEVLSEAELFCQAEILVFVPGGEAAAEKTFNPLLGIAGGISILGTSGIVEPMSDGALTETIRAHLNVLRAAGRNYAVAVPGNMGERFLREYMKARGLSCPPLVTCSNFLGQTIDMAGEAGFSGLLLAGHLGKLVKLGCGIMNTHSREADGRMETLVSCALEAGAGISLLKRISGANTTEEAADLLKEAGIFKGTMDALMERILWHVERRAAKGMKTGVLVFDAKGRLSGAAGEAKTLLFLAAEEERILAARGAGDRKGENR